MLNRARLILLALLAVWLPIAGCGAPRAVPGRPASGALRETLVGIERQAWEAWKTKDASFYRTTLLADAAYVSGGGVSTREQIVNQVETMTCKIDGFVLRNEQVRSLSADVALLTLRAVSDLTCGSRMIHSDSWVSTVFVRDGDTWKIAFHQETDAPQR